MKAFSILIFLAIIFPSCNDYEGLDGTWRRDDPSFETGIKEKGERSGDMILNKDSTFTIVGDEEASKSQISGWSTGEEFKGTWEASGKLLCLYIEGVRVPICYQIKGLSSSQLVLTFLQDSMEMVFKRL